MQQNNQAMAMMNCAMNGLSIDYQAQDLANTAYQTLEQAQGQWQYSDTNNTAWTYWQNCYYPQVILQSYPVYLQDKAMDKGKQAFEILKSLLDKKLIKLEKVSDFVEAMDTILKTL